MVLLLLDLFHLHRQFYNEASLVRPLTWFFIRDNCQAQIEEILEKESIDLVVLARYMQILTKDFCDKHWKHTINIHHRLDIVLMTHAINVHHVSA